MHEPVTEGTSLGLLSWTEVAALDRERTVAILPIAAVEQHGPHLPEGFQTSVHVAARYSWITAVERTCARWRRPISRSRSRLSARAVRTNRSG